MCARVCLLDIVIKFALLQNSKWELVDMGSLNGTTLNSRAINLSQSGIRHWSNPVELSNGDVITLGTNSKLLVKSLTLHIFYAPMTCAPSWFLYMVFSIYGINISFFIILLQVHTMSQIEHSVPFGIGVASDPMAVRRGGKKLPMEDVCYYHWPLPGMDKV